MGAIPPKGLVVINSVIAKVFGTSNERAVKRMLPIVEQINALEAGISALTDEQLRDKTAEFRQRIADHLASANIPTDEAGRQDEDALYAAQKAALDEILPEAFAVVREAGKRAVGMRHFDVQLIGGIVLHSGKIAEMKTGEGKTLVATLPCYLNALAGKGVHVVTVNDYLAKRDAEWMGKIYGFLGLSVGVIVHDLDDHQRREAYGSDITYGTNNEFGFDYLRDNMKFELADQAQRGHYYCIVDEVDSILIDEARTPLIISGPTDQTTDKYARVNIIIPELELGELIETIETKTYSGDFVVDEKARAITVTDEGWEKIEKLLSIGNIADPENWDLKHHVEVAIKAHNLYKRDVEYVVKEGEVIIVDEFTGRLMPGRRWSDGLHQARRSQGRRRHPQGRPDPRDHHLPELLPHVQEAQRHDRYRGNRSRRVRQDLQARYRRDPHQPRQMRGIENSDVVFRTAKEKYFAVADEIGRLHEEKQPVLVGTTSIEKSELLSDILKRKGVRHVVLNAKFHEKEAEIVAQAGRLGMVTIATNMAGRGTDILLGGNSEFMARQDLVKKSQARAVSAAEGAINPVATPGNVRFYYQSQEFETTQAAWDTAIASPRGPRRRKSTTPSSSRRPAYHRHGAPRVAPRRQPASRPRRPSGRPRRIALLPLARRRPHAHLRPRVGLHAVAAHGHGRGRAHREQDDLEPHRGRAEGGRDAELRVPQARPRVRRRDEQAARGRLRPSPPADGRASTRSSSSPTTTSSTILSNILDENAPEKTHPDEWKTDVIFNAALRRLRRPLR